MLSFRPGHISCSGYHDSSATITFSSSSLIVGNFVLIRLWFRSPYYATRYATELNVIFSHVSAYTCTRYNCLIHTGAVCDSVPIAYQLQINSAKLEILVPSYLCNACAVLVIGKQKGELDVPYNLFHH